MSLTYSKVLIFGPTGDAASAAALEASKRNAHVYLAMRNPSKTIPGIQDHSSSNFTRIGADITDPASVKSAVQESGAKAAWLYWIPQPDPSMKATIQALKEGGIEYVVFLSTFLLEETQDLRTVPQKDFIPWGHAQVEIALEDAGIDHVALRPGVFASNSYKHFLDCSDHTWKLSVVWPDLLSDCIVPADIGRVGGAVLTTRPSKSSKDIIFLAGPQVITSAEQAETIKAASQQEIEVVRPMPEEYKQGLLASGVPPRLAEFLIENFEKDSKTNRYKGQAYRDMLLNVERYSGYESTTFEKFVAAQQL